MDAELLQVDTSWCETKNLIGTLLF